MQHLLLPRLYIQELSIEQQQYTLTDTSFHYLVHVLRLKLGDQIRVFAPGPGEWLAAISTIHKREVTITLLECLRQEEAPSMQKVILAVPPLKQAHMGWLIEKVTELGILTIQPVLTQRSQMHHLQISKWQRQAIEAAEQCERLSIPTILSPLPLQALSEINSCLWYGDENGTGTPLATLLQSPMPNSPITLLVGPEGGFTHEEHNFLAVHGQAVHLGPRVLRSETAALMMLISTFLAWGDTLLPLPFRA